MATYVVIQVIGIDAASADEAISLVSKAQGHTPLGKAWSSAIKGEEGGAQIPSPTLMEVGKWLASVYPEVVAKHQAEQKVLNSWERFLCEAEEGVAGE